MEIIDFAEIKVSIIKEALLKSGKWEPVIKNIKPTFQGRVFKCIQEATDPIFPERKWQVEQHALIVTRLREQIPKCPHFSLREPGELVLVNLSDVSETYA